VKKIQPLAEGLSLVVGFDPKALPGVQPTEALLQRGEKLIFCCQATTSTAGAGQGMRFVKPQGFAKPEVGARR
jgi:hypothetical protein